MSDYTFYAKTGRAVLVTQTATFRSRSVIGGTNNTKETSTLFGGWISVSGIVNHTITYGKDSFPDIYKA